MTTPTRLSTLSLPAALAVAVAAAVSACASSTMPAPMFSQTALPASVQVPTGHRVAMETVGAGEITYECRAKAEMAGAHEWVFVGPQATLTDRSGRTVGSYYGPPATWEATDKSKLTGKQLAVAPAAAGSIPLQLVQANPAMGTGAMTGVTYIQRVATRGGVAPAAPCNAQTAGSKQQVRYQADYIFWKAA